MLLLINKKTMHVKQTKSVTFMVILQCRLAQAINDNIYMVQIIVQNPPTLVINCLYMSINNEFQ